MKRLIVSAVAVAASFLVGCGPPPHDRAQDIKSDPPAGTFGGQSWTMTKATLKNDGTTLSVHLFSEAVPDCSEFPNGSSVGYIMFSMPAKVAKRPLQLSFDFSNPDNQTVTFVTPPSTNDIAIDGILNLSALTGTSATLGILANGSTGDAVNGTVTGGFCP